MSAERKNHEVYAISKNKKAVAILRTTTLTETFALNSKHYKKQNMPQRKKNENLGLSEASHPCCYKKHSP